MNPLVQQKIKVGAALVGLVLMVSCSAAEKKLLSAEESVKIRAGERWQALIEGRLEKAYEYETPEYRKVYDFHKYKQGIHGVGLWTKAEVKAVACTDKCVVDAQIYATLKPPRWGDAINSSSLLKEQWMRDTGSGEWFHLSSE